MTRSLAIAFALTAASPAQAARTFLVAIGSNVGDADEHELRYAERDARQVATVMLQLGGVAPADAVLVLGVDAQGVRSALLETNARIRAASSGSDGSVLVIYYSGHADAESLHLGGSRRALGELEGFGAGSPATVRVLALDSCRSGAVTRVKGLQAARPFELALDDRLDVEGVAIVTSSAADEDSHESDRLRGSFFSHHLVSALRGAADENGDDRVTLDEAYAYTYHQTLKSSGRTTQLQHPTYRYDLKGRGALVLTRLASAAGRAGRLRIAESGRYLVLEGAESGPATADLLVRSPGARLVLPPGLYFVQARGRTAYREYRVVLRPGGEVDLAGEPFERVAYARLVRKGGAGGASHGLALLAGARGPLLDAEPATPQVAVGWALDLPYLSLGLRLRGGLANVPALDDVGRSERRELALGLTAERVFDLPWLSLGVGLLAEGVYHAQSFRSEGQDEARVALGAGFGGLLSLERELLDAVTLRLEGGPVSHVLRAATIDGARIIGVELETPLTGRTSAGLRWSLRGPACSPDWRSWRSPGAGTPWSTRATAAVRSSPSPGRLPTSMASTSPPSRFGSPCSGARIPMSRRRSGVCPSRRASPPASSFRASSRWPSSIRPARPTWSARAGTSAWRRSSSTTTGTAAVVSALATCCSAAPRTSCSSTRPRSWAPTALRWASRWPRASGW